jgi:GMP synthase (glutamine-hydrolysing)
MQVQPATVLVVDYGAQYAQLIARRVREAQVYSEIVPGNIPVEEIVARKPAALILSGGPASVYEEGAPRVDPELFTAGIPVLGLCYGFQAMAQALGGEVAPDGTREYGRTELTVTSEPGALHEGLPRRHPVWMSHGDSVVRAPAGFTVTASSERAAVAAFEHLDRRLAGVQYHPEVGHSPHGQEVLRRFLHEVAGIAPGWTTASIIDDTVAAIRAQVGGGRAICGLSGGVDSAVAAALVQRAIGDRLTCVFVDHGLLRAGERAQVERDFVAATGARLHTVDARERFLAALAGVTDPEQKRKIIGREFIRVFEAATSEVALDEKVRFLVQGTLYPDVVESGGGSGTATIKSHHNVGGLPEDMTLELVEPLRALFKDEVRRLGLELGLPDEIVWRQPFPGPGLGVRIIGEVTPERVALLQHADAIVRSELHEAGLDREIWQAFAVLPDIRSVGVMGDERTYGYPVIIRAVTSEDAMTADWARLPYDLLERMSSRIINEVRGVNRVAYDITSKPPGTIEWE